jgi:hypothetical protein
LGFGPLLPEGISISSMSLRAAVESGDDMTETLTIAADEDDPSKTPLTDFC